MLVHLPVACLTLTPVCDVLAIWLRQPALWPAAALIAAFGVGSGLLAATAGAMDFESAQAKAGALAPVHASLMGSALVLAGCGLFGRVDGALAPAIPPPTWAIAASSVAFLVMIVGAWCGGEMVYGRGVGVRDAPDASPARPD
jgi:uncharacterized membrane protein